MIAGTDVKPGYQTTEFWFSAVTQLLTLAVAATPKVGAVVQAIGAIGAIVIPVTYSVLRTFGKAHAAAIVAEAGSIIAQAAQDTKPAGS